PSAYKANSTDLGRLLAQKILSSLPTCPIPTIRRHGKNLKQRRQAALGYLHASTGTNRRTEAINGPLALPRSDARGCRNREHYRLRMLLIGGGLTHPHLR